MKPVALIALVACSLAGISAYAKTEISDEEKIQQALNRLTFGPRPGDVEQVKALGVKKWIDRELHPERTPENPILDAKLRPLTSLTMSPAQMVESYPSPQMVKAMVEGKLPFPDDPDKRLMIRRMVAYFEGKQDQAGKVDMPGPDLATLLPPEQLRTLRSGSAQEKVDLFASLTPERQDQVLEGMGPGMRSQLFAAAPPDMRRRMENLAGPRQIVVRDLSENKILRAVYSDRQLQEVLTDFWYNHFNIYWQKGLDRYLVTSYERDAIRPHVLGKFEDLLRATAQSPAMLFYLDNWQSADPQSTAGTRRKLGLNENYGRELLELHTLGVDGGYTQKDVTEVARSFTGWTIRQPQRAPVFEFNPRMHDNGEKVVLGVRIPAGGGMQDGLAVLHLLAHQPATARVISRELAMRFVADDPPEPLVNRMAATFRKKDGDLREVLKTMFDSPEFWSRAAYRSKLKSPLEMVASSLRAVNADVDYCFGLDKQLTELGQPLYRKAEPTGYPNSGREWANSAGLLARMNFGLALMNNRIPGVKVDGGQKPQMDEAVSLGSPEFQKK